MALGNVGGLGGSASFDVAGGTVYQAALSTVQPTPVQLARVNADSNRDLAAQVSVGGSWDFGFSATQLAREGSVAAVLKAFKLPASMVNRFETWIKSKFGEIAAGLGMTNTDQLLKLEVNIPFFDPLNFNEQAILDDTTIHFKLSPAAWERLSPKQQSELLAKATGLPIDVALRMARGTKPVGNTVQDIRISISPFTAAGGANVRFGSMFFAAGDLISSKRGSFLDLVSVGFVSPRIWEDGTLQLILGIAGDVGVSRNEGLNSGIPGDPFFEVAGFVNIKIKPGQLVKVGSGYGFITTVNGKESVVRIPDSLSNTLPDSFKEQSIIFDTSGKYQLVAMTDFATPIIEGAVKKRDIQAAKDIYNFVTPLLGILTSPETRDAATLFSGLLGYRAGPLVGTISLIASLGQISENRFEDFYAEFSRLNFQNPSQVYGALRGSIDLLIRERASTFGQIDQEIAENERLGRTSGGEFSEKYRINEQTQFAIQKVVRYFDRAIDRSIESGGFKGTTVDVYRELTRLAANETDPVMRNVAAALLGRSSNAQFTLPANQGGGTLTVGVEDSGFRTTFQLLAAIDASAAAPGGNVVSGFTFSKLVETKNPVIIGDITKYYLDKGGDPFTLALQANAFWQKERAGNNNTPTALGNIVRGAVANDRRTAAALAVIAGLQSDFNFDRGDGLVRSEQGRSTNELIKWAKGNKFDFTAYFNEVVDSAYEAVKNGNDQMVTSVWADGKKQSRPSLLLARADRIAYFMLKQGLDFNFGVPLLQDRIDNLKSAISGKPYDPIRDPSVEKNLPDLKLNYDASRKITSDADLAFIKQSLYNSNIFFRSSAGEFEFLYANREGGVGIDSVLPPQPKSLAVIDAAATSSFNAILADVSLSNTQKLALTAKLLADPAISPEKKAELQAILDNGIGKQTREAGNLKTLRDEIGEAKRIATESNNPFGVLLATIAEGVVDTLYAKVDPSTVNLPFAGNINAVAAGAEAAGLTYAQFVQLIGRGDLAAFGALIGDIGEVYKQANLGNTATTTGAGFELVGDSLIALGRQKGDAGLVIAGTTLSGVGGVIKASNDGIPGSATSAGFKLGGNLALALGQAGGSKELTALGIALNAGGSIPALFNNQTFDKNGKPTGNLNDGKAALSEVASQIVGTLVGGKSGAFIANLGSLTATGFRIAGNTVPGGEGALYVTAARQLLALAGVKVDPAVNFALSTLSTALAGGPVGWAAWGVGVLFSLASMGTFTKTLPLAEGIDADGDGFADDSASLRQEFRRGFFGDVKQTKHNILYDVNGVDIRLLQNTQLAITPEIQSQPIEVITNRGNSTFTATINGLRVTGKLVDGDGRTVDARGLVVAGGDDNAPQGGVFFQGLDAYGTPVANQKFAAKAERPDPDFPIAWSFNQPTGNFIIKIDATYSAINPSTAAINTNKTWVLGAADAAVWRNMMGGDIATIGAADPRAADGALLSFALTEMTAQYQGAKNDPNLYMYIDMNGDGIPDRVRVGLQTGTLKVKGDGKIEVWVLDAARKDTGTTYLANNFAEAEEIGLMSGQLLNWGAGRPDLWPNGKDLGSLYVMARNSGALALIKEADALTANSIGALFSGQSAGLESTFARLEQINKALASPFNAAEYMELNPDVAAWANGNPERAAFHYIHYGNNEGRGVNAAGTVLARPVIRSSIEGGVLRPGEMLVSQNGQFFAIFQTDGNFVVYRGTPAMPGTAIWSTGTQGKAAGGFVNMQAQGNLVVYDAASNPVWWTGTEGAGVSRPFTLLMQDNGDLAIYDTKQGGEAIWSHMLGKIATPEANAVAAATVAPVVAAAVAPPAPASVVAAPVVAPVALLPVQRAGQTWLAGYQNVGQSLSTVNGTLRSGQMLASANGQFVTVMQTDNNLVVYQLNADGSLKQVVWNSGTGGQGNGGFAMMQGDGNLVVYNAQNVPLWNAGTATGGVYRAFVLVMQDDGNLVAYDPQGGEALWSSYTGRIAMPEANAA